MFGSVVSETRIPEFESANLCDFIKLRKYLVSASVYVPVKWKIVYFYFLWFGGELTK